MADSDARRAAFLSLHASLAQRRRAQESEPSADDALRLRTAEALDACSRAGVKLGSHEVDVKLLRPPWSSKRLTSARTSAASVADARASLVSSHPEASALLQFLDQRADPLEAYRRLGEARHLPWAKAAVAATVAAVQRVRERTPGASAPCVLVAQGSLGAEAAAAAAAGARVWVAEPNRFARTAITAVARQHGFAHAVHVVDADVESVLHGRHAVSPAVWAAINEVTWDVVVLSPLIDESALSRRLLPAARAVLASLASLASRAGERDGHAVPLTALPPLVVPARVHVHGALALLTAGVVHGVDLTPLDVTRWTPHPIAWAPHRVRTALAVTPPVTLTTLTPIPGHHCSNRRVSLCVLRVLGVLGVLGDDAPWQEEDCTQLCAYRHLFTFELEPPSTTTPAAAMDSHLAHGVADVPFDATQAFVAASNSACGGEGGKKWARCNALVVDVVPCFSAVTNCVESPSAVDAVPPLPPPQKRAVILLEPFIVIASEACILRVSHDGHRLCAFPPPTPATPTSGVHAPFGPADGWGTLLLQHWHFAMVRDAPRNEAYAKAIDRAAGRLLGTREHTAEPSQLAAVDMGSGSGLLAIMLAQSIRRVKSAQPNAASREPHPDRSALQSDHVLGVEIVAGVAELGTRVIAHNRCEESCSIVRAEGHAIMAQAAQRPVAERPRAQLLVAELMDSGGLGEGLLPLAHQARTSGLIGGNAPCLPCRLRVWAFVAELRGCGTALDGCELVPSAIGGVALGPWMAYREIKYYASIERAASSSPRLAPS